MTKSLKVLSSRKFTTTKEPGDSFVGREAISALSVAVLAPADASLGDAGSLADDTILLDDAVGASEVLVLDCLEPKEMILRFMDQGDLGDSSIGALPSPGLEFGDEGAFGVPVGGSVSGVIDFDGDTDDITVFLVSGQTYSVSLRGTGANPLSDALLRVFAPDGVTQVAVDDDGGNRTNSFLTYTATTTGQHIIRAASFNNNPDQFNFDTGSYTVDVRVQGVDAVGFTNATSVPLQLGTTFGFREYGTGNESPLPGTLDGDTDRYSITLEAGHFYTFEVAAGWDGGASGSGALNTLIVLRNAAGGIVAQNDNIGGDLSSAIGFTATVSGTYYLDIHARNNQVGGYVITAQDIDFSSLSPLDAINWFNADNIDTVDVNGTPTAYVYFGAAGESFGELNDAGNAPRESYGWTAKEKAAVMEALLEFSKITGIQYVETADVNQAEFRLMTTTSTQFGAFFYPQDPVFDTQQGIGAFNVNSGGWDKPGVSSQDIPGDQLSLDRGGFSFAVILHEFGHAHGLAHAHDTGGGSQIMPGVFNSTGFFSIYNLNQGVYTVMSYNDAWQLHPDGPSPFTISGIDNGWSATLSAFDIAVLQDRYGVHAHNGGDNVYALTDVIDDAFYECIWDSGGTDAIAYGGAVNAFIDLTAATLDYSPTGGGPLSFLNNPGASTLRGGYTIANGVVIENASTGSGNDQLAGNSSANDLSGNNGNDTFLGRGGDDALHGGAGTDTAFYEGSRADYTVHAVRTNGVITGYTVTDNNTANGNEGTDTLDGIEGLTFTTGPVNLALVGAVAVFDQNDNLVSVHNTIQAAIDAGTTLDGYSIVVSGGSYAEDVNVTKDLTIKGANDGLDGTDAGRFAETVIQSLVITANGVTVDGVSVTGSFTHPNSGLPAGVYVIGNDFSLINSVLDGPSSAYGVLTQGVSGLDVADNLIVHYGAGAYVSGNSSGSFHDNLFQGDGAGSGTGLQNGILSESAVLLIQDNTFDGIDGGSIFVLAGSPATIDLNDFIIGNTITDSGAERPVQIYPNGIVTDVTGTDFNESFNGDLVANPGPFTYRGNGGDDRAYGSALGDTYYGGDGSDRLFGADGDDTLSGDAGNDLLDGEGGTDTALFAENSLSYTDTVVGWLVASSEGNDFLQNTEIVVDGTGQRNLLVGSTAYATLQTALDDAQDGDVVRLASGNYSGTFNYDDAGLTVIAQPGAILNATFATTGGSGISVYGGDSADTITTGDGNDLIVGGAGNDVTAGGNGNDAYIVEQAGDVVNEGSSGGYDTVYALTSYELGTNQEIEVLSVYDRDTSNAINLTGNNLANTIYGNQGTNLIIGGGGDDIMFGLGGNDSYIVEQAGDEVIEGAGGGFDTVYTLTSYDLATDQAVETLTVYDRSTMNALDLGGNNLDNTIYGNAGTNVINARGGNDSLYGMGGADRFDFTTAPGAGNVDAIMDFSDDDTIALDADAFLGIGGFGTLDEDAFVIGTSAEDAEDRIIYDEMTGRLWFDADGNGDGVAILFATLEGAPLLGASDFTVI